MDLAVSRPVGAAAVVLSVSGEVTARTVPELRSRLADLLAPGDRYLVLDLQGVTFLDSAGLQVILGLLRTLPDLGVDLRLVFTQYYLQKLLRVLGIWKLFTVSATVEEAVQQPQPA